MNYAYYRISLDVQDISTQVSLPVRRWDTGRGIQVTLTENGAPYEIVEGCSAEFACVRPNGSVLKNPCEIEGNVILYNFTQLTTSLAGIMECEIRLTGATGELLTSPRFNLVVYSTIYDYGDATESEIANANTVKSANPGYAEVFMWSDGNPDGEDRVGYFVGADLERSAAMVKKATSTSDIRGVSMAAPGFASNAPGGRFDENSSLLPQYCYVGLMGFAPVIDNGRCAVNDRCKPGDDGTAIQDNSGAGYLVVERLDDTHVLIMLDPDADLILKLSQMVEERLSKIQTIYPAKIGTVWTGSTAPYTQEIAVEGLKATDKGAKVDLIVSDDVAAAEAEEEAYACMYRFDPLDNVLKVWAFDKTDREINIQIEVNRYE